MKVEICYNFWGFFDPKDGG